jgi:hypothetical protein
MIPGAQVASTSSKKRVGEAGVVQSIKKDADGGIASASVKWDADGEIEEVKAADLRLLAM